MLNINVKKQIKLS